VRPPCSCLPGDYVPVASGHLPEQAQESEPNVYAIVRAGGRQEKVSVGDVLIIDKVKGESGDSIELTPLLLVDGSTVTTDASKLAKVKVTAEVVKPTKGPKITIMKFKNKTGYRKRQGHRQHSTQIKVTAIEA
jgi:large subunit ribosomal protein L21